MSSGKSPSCHLTDTGLIASWVNEPLDPTKCNCRHKIVVRTSTTRRLYSSIEAQAWDVDPIGSRHSPDWLAYLESADNSRRGFLRASKRPCWKCQSQSAGVRAFGRHYLVFLMISFRCQATNVSGVTIIATSANISGNLLCLGCKATTFGPRAIAECGV